MIVHRARWVLPIGFPVIEHGWVAVEDGVVVALGDRDSAPPGGAAGLDGGAGRAEAILPGLVNAHTHLELSWMRGQVPPAGSMPAWAARLMSLRRTVGAEPRAPILEAVREARSTGTALVGDITNTFAAYDALLESDLSAMIFREMLGFNVADPARLVAETQAQAAELTPVEWLRIGVVPHAPYSVSPGLFRAIAEIGGALPVSVHLAESAEEIEFLLTAGGAWRSLLEELGVWTSGWQPPRCGPVEYLDRLGLLSERLLAVHAVRLTDTELAALARAGATVVTCPRSNNWTGAGTPSVSRFYRAGVRVAIGTDSLASVEDLSLFEELKAVRMVAPDVAASTLLRSATLDGATALGFADQLGSIERGKRAELLAVRIPAEISDVEEYLVRHVGAGDIRWLEKH